MLSSFQSSMAQHFGKSGRNGVHKHTATVVPGPGSYRVPSEFGYYAKKVVSNAYVKPKKSVSSKSAAAASTRGPSPKAKPKGGS